MAAIWVGGLIYTAAVAVPFAVSHEAEERQRILRGLGRRFRRIAWVAMAVLIITGLGNLLLRYSPIRISQLFNGEAFDPNKVDGFIAVWLPWKLMLVVVMIVLMLYHDITSIQAAKRHEGSRESAPGRRSGTMAAALATLLAIAIVYVSVRMVRG
ncbi:MAG: CopD family protein [Blastocatellia bacterium]|nr:CopD family protein [Blastocatellia bacterium]